MLARRQRQAALGLRRFVREEAEVFGAALRRGRHEADRLARVERLEQRDLLGARLDRAGDRVQQRAPVLARQVAPRGERVLRGVGGRRDVGRVAGLDLGEHAVVDRRARRERAAGGGRARRAGDEMPDAVAREPRDELLRLRDVRGELARGRRAPLSRAHGPAPARFARLRTCSCRLFFLKLSTGWNSWTFSEIASGLLS